MMKRPTLADAARELLAWKHYIPGILIHDDTVDISLVSNDSTITPGRSDKDQVSRWLYERYFDLCKVWMDWAENQLEAEI